MKNLKFGIVTTLLAGLLTACPQPPPAPVVSSVTVTGAPADNNIKMNVPVPLTAAALDSSGTAIAGATFTWVSSNPDAVSVDAAGVVTAKKFGTAIITASSGGVSGATASQTTYGLEATFGTWVSNENLTYGTVVLYRLRLKAGETIPAGTVLSSSVNGPTGWNSNIPSVATCSIGATALNAKGCFGLRVIGTVTGNYQMSLTYNNESFASQSVAVDTTTAPLGRPVITITAASVTDVSANWTSVPEAQGYFMRALNNTGATSDKYSPWLTTTSATITGLTLDTTKNPSVFIYAYNFDTTNSNIATMTFPSNAKASSQGKAVTIPTLGVSGQIPNYSNGEKALKIVNGQTTLATGTLSANGSFNIGLPALNESSLIPLVASTCTTGSSSVVPNDAKFGLVTVRVYDNANSTTQVGSITQQEPEPTPAVGAKETYVSHYFVNKDVVLSNVNCTSATSTGNGTWTLKAGWNEVYSTTEITEMNGTTVTKKVNSFGMGTQDKPFRFVTGTGFVSF